MQKKQQQQKKINSKRKGNRAELELAKILTKRFGLPFTRVGVSSGARPKQVELDDSAKQVFTSDLVAPSGFRFSVECKAVNVNIDLLAQSALLDKFLDQAASDAASIGKLPLLCWKRNRKGWIAAVPIRSFSIRLDKTFRPDYCSLYRDWVICRLDALLVMDTEELWFDTQELPHRSNTLIQNNTRRLIADDK